MQILVGGTGRSGTTILGKILGLHDDIFFPSLKFGPRVINPELRLLADPDGCIDLILSLSDHWDRTRSSVSVKRFIRLTNNIMKDSSFYGKRYFSHLFYGKILPRFSFSGPSYGTHFYGDILSRKNYREALKRFLEDIIDVEFRGQNLSTKSWSFRPTIYGVRRFTRAEIATKCGLFVQELFTPELEKNHKTHWCDASPPNILHVDILKEMFPEAKFIHIYRDPRDVISSSITKIWGGNRIEDVIGWIRTFWEKWWFLRDKLDDSDFFEIRLEGMLKDPEIIIKKVFSFLNITVDDSYIQNVKALLTTGNVGRWKKSFNKKEKEIINRELGNLLDLLNY